MKNQWDSIVKVSCKTFGIKESDFYGKQRKQEYVACRAYVITYWKQTYPYYSWQRIANLVGRERTCVADMYYNFLNGAYVRIKK